MGLVLTVTFALTALAAGETVRIGAAISLRAALEEIGRQYEAATEDRIEWVFGSSGQIAAQVKAGAAIDVVISAAMVEIDALAEKGLIDAASRRIIASNALVLVTPVEERGIRGFADLGRPEVDRVAMGVPAIVPAGRYAEQVLQELGLTEAVADKLVYARNVRQVLAYVERGEVAAGMVYATDARESGPRVRVVAPADAALHDPIVYPAAVTAASGHAAAARRFMDYLATPAAQAALTRRGFVLPAPVPTTQPAGQ